MIENIKALYEQIESKNKFFELIANEFKLEPSSIKTNWFSNWSIPKKRRERVIEILQKTIALQNENVKA